MANHKLGVVGAGAFTDFTLESYRQHLPQLELVAITDPKTELAESLAKKYEIPQVAENLSEILGNQEVDIVLVLTPPNTHASIAKQALLAGKHVLVEKPIAFSETGARELIALADANELQLSANLVLRHHPFHLELSNDVKNNKYGPLRQISTLALLAKYPEGHWYWDKNISGGFFLNTFCHFIDLYDFVTNETPQKLSSSGSVENGYAIVSNFPEDRLATLNVNLNVSNEQERVETTYIFDKAIVKTDGWLPHRRTITTPDGEQVSEEAQEKISLYQEILSNVMRELIERIEDPNAKTIITHQSLLQAVLHPTRAEQN